MSDDRDTTRGDEHLETTAVRAGRDERSLAPPLWATSTFAFESAAEGFRLSTTPRATFYTRHGNPTIEHFEEAVAELEGAAAAQAFASGMGAISTVVFALCSQGGHVVAQRQLYSATASFFQGVLPRFGIDVTLVDGTRPEAFADAVEPGRTVLLFAETPTNPLLQLVDLDAVGALEGPVKVCDSTFAGPMIQRPLEHGFDLVLHSATKSLAGHNDATLGVIAGSVDLVQWIWAYHTMHGAVASPFDALNALRGIRTLGVRSRQQAEGAQHVAEFLEQHSAVERVHYPGLNSHPQRDLAKRQMATGGGVLSFEIAGGEAPGRKFVESVHIARLANSLGGPDTLVTHPATMTAANLPPEERAAHGITDGLVRVSVGLEHPDDLVADIGRALGAATS